MASSKKLPLAITGRALDDVKLAKEWVWPGQKTGEAVPLQKAEVFENERDAVVAAAKAVAVREAKPPLMEVERAKALRVTDKIKAEQQISEATVQYDIMQKLAGDAKLNATQLSNRRSKMEADGGGGRWSDASTVLWVLGLFIASAATTLVVGEPPADGAMGGAYYLAVSGAFFAAVAGVMAAVLAAN